MNGDRSSERKLLGRRDSSETSTEEGEDTVVSLRRDRSPRLSRASKKSAGSKTRVRTLENPSEVRLGRSGRYEGAPTSLPGTDLSSTHLAIHRNPVRSLRRSPRRSTQGNVGAAAIPQEAGPNKKLVEIPKSRAIDKTESEDDSASSTTVSRRCSDSDSGVNLSPVKPFKDVNFEARFSAPERDDSRQLLIQTPREQVEVIKDPPEKLRLPERQATRFDGGSASMNYSSSVPMAGLPMAGAVFGLCLGGPVGLMAGIKLGGVVAVGGSILGYTGAKVISEHRELREYMDDHYKKNPEIFVQSPREDAQRKRRGSLYTPPDTPRFSTSPVRSRDHHRNSVFVKGNSVPLTRRGTSSASLRSTNHLRTGSSPLPLRSNNNSPIPLRRATSFRSGRVRLNKQQAGFESDTQVNRQGRNLPAPRQYRRFQDQTTMERESLTSLISRGEVLQTRGSSDLPGTRDHPQRQAKQEERNTLEEEEDEEEPTIDNFSKRRWMERSKRTCSLPDVLEEDSLSNKS